MFFSWIVTLTVLTALCISSYTDIKRFEVEDNSIILCSVLCLVFITLRSAVERDIHILIGSLITVAAAFAGGFILCLFGMGFGDVKFMMLIGAAGGFVGLCITMLAGSVFGAAYGLVKYRGNVKKGIPFVPFMLIGYILSIAFDIYITI